jgi:preprotein translocase subunit YajC
MDQLGSLLPLVLLLGVMYFVLIRPQQQRVKAQRALVTSLVIGDEVITIGGLLGRIISIDDETATIETTPGTVVRCRRTAIAGRAGPADAPADDATGDDEV